MGPLLSSHMRQAVGSEDRLARSCGDGPSARELHWKPGSDPLKRWLRECVECATEDNAHRCVPLHSTAALFLHACLVTAVPAAALPFSQGVTMFCHLMLPARNSRIVLASNRICVLAPVATTPQTHAPNISLLLSEKSGCCVGLTADGVLFGLSAPCSSTRNLGTSATHHPHDDPSSVGSRCMPVTARDGMHSMHAAAACIFSELDWHQASQAQQPRGGFPVVIVYFAPPPIPSNAPINLRVDKGGDVEEKGSGCLQAHSVGDGQLLRVFEGCGDDISCVAVSSGDKVIGRYLLAGSDKEAGGATLFMWPLPPHGQISDGGERLVPLLISVQAEKVFPACGAITCIVGRAADVIIAFAGGKIAIFSLVSRSFKCGCSIFVPSIARQFSHGHKSDTANFHAHVIHRFCTSVASVVRAQPQLSVDAVTCMATIGNFFITGSRDGGVRCSLPPPLSIFSPCELCRDLNSARAFCRFIRLQVVAKPRPIRVSRLHARLPWMLLYFLGRSGH